MTKVVDLSSDNGEDVVRQHATVADLFAEALAAHQAGELDEAQQRYQLILETDPEHVGTLTNLGALFLQVDDPERAIERIELSLAIDPNQAAAHNNCGNAYKDLKRFDEALASYSHAISLRPENADSFYNRGIVLQRLRRYEDALASYSRVLALKPDYSKAHYNRGVILQELSRFDEALSCYERSIAQKPEHADSLNNCGVVLHELGRFEEALVLYERATALRPDYAEALNNRGSVLNHLGRYDEALACCTRAITLQPDCADAFSNRADVLRSLRRLHSALASYDRAIALRPDFAGTFNNRGLVLRDLKRYGEALASYDHSLSLDPDHPEVTWNKAMLLLLTGRYEEGWKVYEERWQTKEMKRARRHFKQPPWLGESSVAGKTILLHHEQGSGDGIQMLRYATLLSQQGARVVVETVEPLAALASTAKGVASVIRKGDALGNFDLHCPCMSLPLAFGTTVDSIPANTPYLSAPPSRIEVWRKRLGRKTRTRIGLKWSGSTTNPKDRDRSMAFQDMAPLLELDAEFHSLEKEYREGVGKLVLADGRIHDHSREFIDLADTAALIERLDLVISVDTSVAHLAGALNKPVWIVLAYVADYRWLVDRDESPWYPSARLFRQTRFDNWETVINDVKRALESGCE